MLCRVGWFRTDVSGLRIGPVFKGQDVPKRQYKTNLRCVTSQKTTEFRHTAAKAYDLAKLVAP